MTREEFDIIRPQIVDILANLSPLTPHELLDALTSDPQLQLQDSDARNAIWRLIDDGDIRLSLDRKFEVAIPQD